MQIKSKLGNLKDITIDNRIVDYISLEWHETDKRIWHRKTFSGRAISTKFLGENPHLTQGDILYMDDETIIAVDILPCYAIVIKPKSMFEMASICYEIGNKHLPLFYHEDEVLVAYDASLHQLLDIAGYQLVCETRKLLNPIKNTVAVHVNQNFGTSLFLNK